MRVLVTGSSGLLGTAIVREFATAATVLPLDRRSLDVTDDAAVQRRIAGARPDVVVNCTVYNGVDRAEDEPAEALGVNAFAVSSLARASQTAGAIFVHYSSDFVFDGETGQPYTEMDAANPLSVYGASKLLGDWFALESPRAYVLRVESLFGPSAHATRRGSLATIVERIKAGEEVPVFTDRVVSPTYTPDAARATRALVESGALFGLYHCVNGGRATWAEIAHRVAEVMGQELRPRELTLATAGLRARRPRYCALSNAKLASAGVGMPEWQEAVAEYLAP